MMLIDLNEVQRPRHHNAIQVELKDQATGEFLLNETRPRFWGRYLQGRSQA